MKPYLKGLHLTLGSCRPYRNEKGCRIMGEELKIAELDVKWEDMG